MSWASAEAAALNGLHHPSSSKGPAYTNSSKAIHQSGCRLMAPGCASSVSYGAHTFNDTAATMWSFESSDDALLLPCKLCILQHICLCLPCSADGLTQQVLSSFAKLKPAKDSVLALAATVVLLMLTSEDAHPTYLASVAAAVLFDQLLQVG